MRGPRRLYRARVATAAPWQSECRNEGGGAREEALGSQGGEAVNKGPDNKEEEEEEDEEDLALQVRAQYRREAMSAIYTAFDALNASETADGEIDLQEFMLVGKVAFLPRRPL